MKLERFKNAKRNTFWGMISKGVLLIFPFAVKNLIIKNLGIEYLGLNGLFTSILSILNLTELGVGSAIVYSMYEPVARNDEKKICALMNLYKRIYRYIGLVVLCIGVLLIPVLPLFISGNVPSNINIYILYSIYLANSVISYWLFAYKNCLLQVYQRSDITSKITILLNILMYSMQICVLIFVQNYYAYVIIIPLFSILLNIINAYYSTKIFPQYKCEGDINKKELKKIINKVAGLMINKIAYASRNAFDRVGVSSFLGLELVAIYNNYYYIVNSLSAIMVIFTTAISAGIGNSLVIENKEKNLNDLNVINFLYMTLAGFAFSCLIVLYQPFMRIWVGDSFLFSNSIMFWFAEFFLIEKTENIIGQYFDAAGLWWKGKWKGIIEAATNFILNIILCHWLGVSGVIIATIISLIFVGMPLTVYYVYKNVFEKSAIKYIFRQYLYSIAFTLIGIMCYGITSFIPSKEGIINEIVSMIVKLLVTTIITGLTFLLIFRKTIIFKQTMIWIKKHIKNL